MKAICITESNSIALLEVPKPAKALPGHLLIKMHACGINAGDKAFIAGAFAPGSAPVSLYDVCGVSGVGTVIEAGEGVPDGYTGKKVTVYRSLQFGDSLVGTWCGYAHLNYLQCVVLPDEVNMEEYSGSLVNTITPYAFLKQIEQEGHKGIISTAGSSATGIAMIGVGLAYNFPVLSVVRTQQGKEELEALGARNIVVQDHPDFKLHLKEMAQQLQATAVFDGVGGAALNNMIDVLLPGTTIYSYGYLGGSTPLTFNTSVLMKGITIKSFGNFKSQTVQNPQNLEKALNDIAGIIHMPHFRTKTGKKFMMENIQEALQYTANDGGKAVILPSF